MTEARPTTLYRAFGADGTLLYIGISVDADRRIRQHAKCKPWWPEVARVEREIYASQWNAAAAERAAIQRESPVHNVRHDADLLSKGHVLWLMGKLGQPISSAMLDSYLTAPPPDWPAPAGYMGRTPLWSRSAVEAYARAVR